MYTLDLCLSCICIGIKFVFVSNLICICVVFYLYFCCSKQIRRDSKNQSPSFCCFCIHLICACLVFVFVFVLYLCYSCICFLSDLYLYGVWFLFVLQEGNRGKILSISHHRSVALYLCWFCIKSVFVSYLLFSLWCLICICIAGRDRGKIVSISQHHLPIRQSPHPALYQNTS